jgi:organic radical activating enzyme
VDYQETKDKLNNIGCGMCLAKWTQVTIHLQNGHTHSCHHPKTHKIPLKELEINPTALHNTEHKKKQRRMMLGGIRPPECDYCWNVEDNSDEFSDRIYKSNSDWSDKHWDKFEKKIDGTNYLIDWKENFNPSYVEVVFSSACNLKCSYCAPHISSKWMEEIEKHGYYPTSTKFNNLQHLKNVKAIPIPLREPNPYVEAFWKWWPDLYRDLHTFRITGGEPLLSKDTFKVLDAIIEEKNPNRELVLSINTNMMVPDDLIDKFIEKVNIITKEKRVKEFQMFTSVDTWGKDAEYIRNGLIFDKFWDNCNKFLRECSIPSLTFMVTYNALSVFNFDKFIEGVYELKSNYLNEYRICPPHSSIIDISYLRYPTHQTVKVLPRETWSLIRKQVNLMKKLQRDDKGVEYFTDMEISKLERIFDWLKSKNDRKQLFKDKKDFGLFFREHDKRRNTNFLETFPLLEKLYGSSN